MWEAIDGPGGEPSLGAWSGVVAGSGASAEDEEVVKGVNGLDLVI